MANFHTHPLENNQLPSKADLENAYGRNVPGIIIARNMIYVYGPERRQNFRLYHGDPRAYPNDGDRSRYNRNIDINRYISYRRQNPWDTPYNEF